MNEMKLEAERLYEILMERSPHHFCKREREDTILPLKERVLSLEYGFYLELEDLLLLVTPFRMYDYWCVDRYVKKGYEKMGISLPIAERPAVGELVNLIMGEIRASEARVGSLARSEAKIEREVRALDRIATKPSNTRTARDRWAFGG